MNYGLNKAIGDDETGFRGVSDDVYRMEGWDFILAGGALYNNLDYSFAAGYEDGTFEYPASQPGGGSRTLRRQLKILAGFIGGFDFLRMTPENGVITDGVPAGGSARALVERGRAVAIYMRKKRPAASAKDEPPPSDPGPPGPLRVNLSEGQWRGEWVDPITGKIVGSADIPGGGVRALPPPDYALDIALRLRRVK
jgi:hypothetical protein